MKKDVAISFLSRDEPLALEIHRHLSEGLEVFLYSKEQENIAGTDGLESFRKAFLVDSRVVVVLYRDGWGQTPWTRVEEGAIKDRFLAEGWHWLFFVVVDSKCVLPKWLPKTHIRFSMEDYGVEQAVGAIKARVQVLGGTIKKLDALGRAKILEKDNAFREKRRHLFSSLEGVNIVRQEVLSIYKEVERLSKEIMANTKVSFFVQYTANECVLTDHRVSLHVTWCPRSANSLENSPIRMLEVSGRVLLPRERGHFMLWGKPPRLNEHEFLPDFNRSLDCCWRQQQKTKESLNSAEVADECVTILGEPYEKCPECNCDLTGGRLFFPDDEKDYAKDELIYRDWLAVKKKLQKAFHLTIFGYSGPATDYNAKNLLLDGWKQTPVRDISHVEIIDINDPDILRKSWSKFFPHYHNIIESDFWDSSIALWPRRTSEWKLSASRYGIPSEHIGPYRSKSLNDVQNWFNQLAKTEVEDTNAENIHPLHTPDGENGGGADAASS